jgi:hypothetical protein
VHDGVRIAIVAELDTLRQRVSLRIKSNGMNRQIKADY